jgi:hypothetical protein
MSPTSKAPQSARGWKITRAECLLSLLATHSSIGPGALLEIGEPARHPLALPLGHVGIRHGSSSEGALIGRVR